jgi:hypothetical protein
MWHVFQLLVFFAVAFTGTYYQWTPDGLVFGKRFWQMEWCFGISQLLSPARWPTWPLAASAHL